MPRLLDPVASECMPGGMQVDVLVDRLRKVEAQIAQKERVAGTDLATLKVPVLSCTPVLLSKLYLSSSTLHCTFHACKVLI